VDPETQRTLRLDPRISCEKISLHIRRLSYALGAELIGVDLRTPVDDATFIEIRAAFLNHCVLLFRGVALTREQHVAFSKRFGELYDNNDKADRFKHAKHPEILLGSNPRVKGKPTDQYQGEHWHTDRSFTCDPPMASLLRAVEIPDIGGDTMFANMYLAYDTLSDGMKKLIAGLHSVHVGGSARATGAPPRVAQPLVRIHPETDRKALYIGAFKKVIPCLVGMTEQESQPLIQFLCDHATRPRFCYRHQWRKDDLVIWDNRCLMHNALGDYDRTKVRDMERTTVMGTPSGYVYPPGM